MTLELALAPCRDENTLLPDHVACSSEPAILAAILLPSTTLSIWRRDIEPMQRGWLADLDLDDIEDVRLNIEIGDAQKTLRRALLEAGYPDGTPLDTLAHDIAKLAQRHADLLDRERMEVRLEVIETDACRKFHADYGSVRLICTYRGPGTLWLDQDAAAVQRAGTCSSALNIRQLRTGDVAGFKGRLWAPETAIVHRSPPIAGTGEQRLVLVIDPAGDQPDDRNARTPRETAKEEQGA